MTGPRCAAAVVFVALALVLAACGDDTPTSATKDTSQLEVVSWWTSGSEAAALDTLFAAFGELNPGVEAVNAAVAGDEVAEGKNKGKVRVSGKKARELLGRRRVFAETRRRTKDPGVATGLAWTPTGGDVLFIEATAMPGTGKLTITGQLGEVMKESAQAALSWVRGNWAEIAPQLGEEWFAEHDIHIHVPAGAVPKDGPSAGVAMTVALASLISGRPVRNDVAMTGEVTLTGQVLPIGGLKEKSLAAQRAGIKRIIVPDRNAGDVEEIPEQELGNLEFVFVDEVSEALDVALS